MKPFARGLALGDEHEQAAFLNAFAAELRTVCKHLWSNQTFYMARNLDMTTVEVLKEIVDAAVYAQEDRQKNLTKLRDVSDELRRVNEQLEQKREQLGE